MRAAAPTQTTSPRCARPVRTACPTRPVAHPLALRDRSLTCCSPTSTTGPASSKPACRLRHLGGDAACSTAYAWAALQARRRRLTGRALVDGGLVRLPAAPRRLRPITRLRGSPSYAGLASGIDDHPGRELALAWSGRSSRTGRRSPICARSSPTGTCGPSIPRSTQTTWSPGPGSSCSRRRDVIPPPPRPPGPPSRGDTDDAARPSRPGGSAPSAPGVSPAIGDATRAHRPAITSTTTKSLRLTGRRWLTASNAAPRGNAGPDLGHHRHGFVVERVHDHHRRGPDRQDPDLAFADRTLCSSAIGDLRAGWSATCASRGTFGR